MFKNKKKTLNLIFIIIVFVFISSINIISYAETPSTDGGFIKELKNMAAKWYYISWYLSIALMLVTLIYLGIRLAIATVSEQKAKYKRMLMDWVVGMAIIFGIHYFMIAILWLNDTLLDIIDKFSDKVTDMFLDPDSHESALVGAGLYQTIRTRAYELRLSIGTSGMVMYMVLIYYTVRFLFIYFKRLFTLLILTIVAPFMGVTYAYTKINTGKSPILKRWAGEYAFNVLLQSIHALMYGVFVNTALVLSTESLTGFILAMVMMHFMLKAGSLFRKIFRLSSNFSEDNDSKSIKENMAGALAAKAAVTGFMGSNAVKAAKSNISRRAGAIGNVALYGGLSAYNRALQSNDEKLESIKEDSDKLQDELDADERSRDESLTEEQRKKYKQLTEEQRKAILKDKNKLDAQIARMEGRRNRIKRYKGHNESKTSLGSLINDKNVKKKVDEEYQKKLADKDNKDKDYEKIRELNKDLEDDTLTKEERELKTIQRDNYANKIKASLEKTVEKKYNNRIKRRKVEYNPRTRKYEVKDSIAKQLKGDLSTAIWGNSEIKQATKDMNKLAFGGVKGMGEMLVGIPLAVTNPAIGFGLLAKGIKNTNKLMGNGDYKKVTTYGYRRHIKNIQKKNIKNYKKQKKENKQNIKQNKKENKQEIKEQRKYKFNSYSGNTLQKIILIAQDEINEKMTANVRTLTAPKIENRMNKRTNTIRNIDNMSIAGNIIFAPLHFTGIRGAARNLSAASYKVEKAKLKRAEVIDVATAYQVKRALNKDHERAYNRQIKQMKDGVVGARAEDTILDQKEKTGNIFGSSATGRKYQFTTSSISATTQTDMMDNALITVAANNLNLNLRDLNLNDKRIQNELLDELSKYECLTDIDDLKERRTGKDKEKISRLMGILEERKLTLIGNNPDVVKEKVAQKLITETMQGHPNEEGTAMVDYKTLADMKTEEGRDEIVEKLVDKLDPYNIPNELDLKIQEIVQHAMEETKNPDELRKIVYNQIKETLIEERNAEKSDERTRELIKDMKKRKRELLGETELSLESNTLEEKLEKLVEKGNINTQYVTVDVRKNELAQENNIDIPIIEATPGTSVEDFLDEAMKLNEKGFEVIAVFNDMELNLQKDSKKEIIEDYLETLHKENWKKREKKIESKLVSIDEEATKQKAKAGEEVVVLKAEKECTIETFVSQMLEAQESFGKTALGKFNGVEIEIKPDATREQIRGVIENYYSVKTDEATKKSESTIEEILNMKPDATKQKMTDEEILSVSYQTNQVLENIDDIIGAIGQREEKKKEVTSMVENLINGLEEVKENTPKLTEREKDILSSEEIVDKLLDTAKEQKIKEEKAIMDERYLKIEEFKVTKETPELPVDHIINDICGGVNNSILQNLLATKMQDEVLVKLKVKPDSSDRKKYMQIDEERQKLYGEPKKSVDDLINQIYEEKEVDDHLSWMSNIEKEREERKKRKEKKNDEEG